MDLPPGEIESEYDIGWEPANLVWDSGAISGEKLSASVPASLLSESATRYLWRASVCDSVGAWSLWSEPTEFTTKTFFSDPAVTPPTLTVPAGDATTASLTPTLTTAAFAVANGSDTHVKTQWQIRRSTGNYTSPLFDLESEADLLTHAMALGFLNLSGKYFWRARHQGTTYGWSDWSAESSFNTPAVVTPPSFAVASIKTFTSGFTSQMAYDAADDALYLSGQSENGLCVHRFKTGRMDRGGF